MTERKIEQFGEEQARDDDDVIIKLFLQGWTEGWRDRGIEGRMKSLWDAAVGERQASKELRKAAASQQLADNNSDAW